MTSPARRFPWRSLETAAWLVVFGFLAWRLSPQVAAALGVGAPGDRAPAFEVRTLDGAALTSEQLRGRVVLVNFWATWCPPCRWEMPAFERVYRDERDRGFLLLGLSRDRGGEAEVREFLAERGITYPVAFASDDLVRAFGGVQALPTSILIDRQGRVRRRVSGIFAEPTLRMAVDRLLDEPAPSAPVGKP